MTIARIENGVIAERREIAIDDVPEHKRSAWKPIVYSGNGPIEAINILGDHVEIVRSVQPPTTERIKMEAQRRIIALTGTSDLMSCMIKQANWNMRANLLNDIRMARNLTDAESDEAEALRVLAHRIDGIRARSNELESMSTIPADYTDDKYWVVNVSPSRPDADRVERLRRQLAVGLQMTDAMFDIIGGVTPSMQKYPDLANVLGVGPGATLGEWRDAIQALKGTT